MDSPVNSSVSSNSGWLFLSSHVLMFLGWILLEHGLVGLKKSFNIHCWLTYYSLVFVPGIVCTQVMTQGSIPFHFELVVFFEGLADLSGFWAAMHRSST